MPASPSIPKPRDVEVSSAGVTIDDRLVSDLTVEALTAVLGEARVVRPPSRDANEYGLVPPPLFIWDAAGVWAQSLDGEVVEDLVIRLASDPAWEQDVSFDLATMRPRQVFSGRFTVDGRPPLEAIPEQELRSAYLSVEADAGDWKTTFDRSTSASGPIEALGFGARLRKSDTDEIAALVRAAEVPFREALIGHYPVTRQPVSSETSREVSGRWTLASASGPVLEFSSLPFKLAIVQELMFDQDALTPRFDVYDFATDQGASSFDPEKVGHEVIPSVRGWFERLPVPAQLASRVRKLTLDGGHNIYLQLAPLWDGEDDQFVIESLPDADLGQFPNLREIDDIGGFLGPKARQLLTARGITV